MNYSSIETDLISRFPHLREHDDYADAAGLLHVVFGSYFCPWLRGLLNASVRSQADEVEIAKAFALIEEMLESDDEGLENIVLVTVLNYLVDYCGMEAVAPWCEPLSSGWLDKLPPP